MGKVFKNVLLIVCVIVFCVSAWKLWSIWHEYQVGSEIYSSVQEQVAVDDSQKDKDSDKDPLFVDMDKLRGINEYAIGWIRISDTAVDYPILHPEDNDQYLRRTITGEYNKAGCIFVDYQIEKPFKEANTIIYGHNLLNGKMFNDLTKYQEKSFWEGHKDIYIQFGDQILTYRIYSCYRAETGGQSYTLGLQKKTQEYQEFLDWTGDKGLYPTGIEPTDSDTIITLSTCTNEYETERFIVHAVRYR